MTKRRGNLAFTSVKFMFSSEITQLNPTEIYNSFPILVQHGKFTRNTGMFDLSDRDM